MDECEAGYSRQSAGTFPFGWDGGGGLVFVGWGSFPRIVLKQEEDEGEEEEDEGGLTFAEKEKV